jgi:hypothetical protein
MFNKNDPLINSVKQVMAENDLRRKVEKQLNEELNITSKKGLPFEYHAEYDALLEQRMKEELVGNQHKIDANKNNRVDAHDFKLLRAKKDMNEEEQQIDELKGIKGPGKKDEYVKKAKASVGGKIMKAGLKKMFGLGEPSDDDMNTIQKRVTGIARAGDRRTASDLAGMTGSNMPRSKKRKMNEEEQLDEKAVSKAQQRFFGLVRGIQKGEAEGSAKAEKAAKEMSTKEVKKFAKTKQKGLPEKVDEDFDLEAVLEEIRANIGEEAFNELMNEQVPLPPRRPQTGPAGTASQPQASNPRGETVTGIKKTGGGDYNVYQKKSQSASEFQQLYGAARKAGAGKFEWQGRQYATGKKGGMYQKPADQAAAENRPGSGTQTALNQLPKNPDVEASRSQTPSGRVDRTAMPSVQKALRGDNSPENNTALDAASRTTAAAQQIAPSVRKANEPAPGQTPGATNQPLTLGQRAAASRALTQQGDVTSPRPTTGTIPRTPPANVPTPPPRPAAPTPPERERRQPAVSGSTMAGFPGLDEGKGSYMRESLETTIKKVLKG